MNNKLLMIKILIVFLKKNFLTSNSICQKKKQLIILEESDII
jgi:hypothetical protein